MVAGLSRTDRRQRERYRPRRTSAHAKRQRSERGGAGTFVALVIAMIAAAAVVAVVN